MTFPQRIFVGDGPNDAVMTAFRSAWRKVMDTECHAHSVWRSQFAQALNSPESPANLRFELAAVWAANMVAGSYCFPRYVAALAGRAESDVVRHGLLENAWDESGGIHNRARSHFWLAVRLARLLGLTHEEIATLKPLPAAAAYTEAHYRECAEGDFETALGMLCLIEEFTTPEFTMLFRALLGSCEAGNGLAQADFILRGGAEYFTANISDDERHRNEMPRLVAAHLQYHGTDLLTADLIPELRRVIEGIRHSIELRSHFFENIYRFVTAERGTYRTLNSGAE